jgi:YegS/Rv2252/BmrU family lipid kinase
MAKIIVVGNPRSGNGHWQKYRERFLELNDAAIFEIGKNSPEQCIREQGDDLSTVVAVGGDGTISAVASAIMRTGKEVRLGVIPLGTFNHFAKDLGIPLDIEQAIDAVKKAKTTLIDVARVNDFYFINNSGIGLYPYLIQEREHLEKRGIHKIAAYALVILRALLRRYQYTISFRYGEKTLVRKASSVLVGNNKYALEGLQFGERATLDTGTLSVAIIRSRHILGVITLFLKALAGNVLRERDIDVIGLTSCTIGSRGRDALVSHDGEIAVLKTPLRYTIVPKALKVIVAG